jgi:hypothetical protein
LLKNPNIVENDGGPAGRPFRFTLYSGSQNGYIWPVRIAGFVIANMAIIALAPSIMQTMTVYTLLFAPLLLFAIIALPCAWLFALCVSIHTRAWKTLLFGCLIPAACLVVFVLSFPTNCDIRAKIDSGAYNAIIARHGPPTGHRVIDLDVYDDQGGFTGSPISFLVFDESDLLALPRQAVLATLQNHPPHAPKDGIETLRDCAGKAERISTQYYICTLP